MAKDPSECKGPGVLRPVIDRNRCEGKADCERVCPYDVFALRKLTAEERRELSLGARFRLFVHGGKQAFLPNVADCHACGLCVTACPEKAIRLVAVGRGVGRN
jgi:NAD-dependent dihydropyrimidine dehydrogenase PreA subunit